MGGLDGVEGGLECDGLSYDEVNSGYINSLSESRVGTGCCVR